MKQQYRIMVYDGINYSDWGYGNKIIKRYKPQELKSILWGLFTYWENISDYDYATEEQAMKPINNLKLHREVYNNNKNNITYINK
jgi:hypothetical protein